jgi:hypothetical protein
VAATLMLAFGGCDERVSVIRWCDSVMRWFVSWSGVSAWCQAAARLRITSDSITVVFNFSETLLFISAFPQVEQAVELFGWVSASFQN